MEEDVQRGDQACENVVQGRQEEPLRDWQAAAPQDTNKRSSASLAILWRLPGALVFHWLNLSESQVLWCFAGYTVATPKWSGASLAKLERLPGALVLRWLNCGESQVLWCFAGYTVAIARCSGASLATLKRLPCALVLPLAMFQ